MNKNTQFFATKNPVKAKKLHEALTFSKSLSTKLLKAECFIEIAKGLNVLRVVANFKASKLLVNLGCL